MACGFVAAAAFCFFALTSFKHEYKGKSVSHGALLGLLAATVVPVPSYGQTPGEEAEAARMERRRQRRQRRREALAGKCWRQRLCQADDLGWGDVGYNNPSVSTTPNIDRLAREGIRLDAFYTSRICTPSRASLLTGRWAFKTGELGIKPTDPDGIDPDYMMFPAILRSAGYRTHLMGKWHQGLHKADLLPTRRGFETFFGILTGGANHYTQRSDGLCDWGGPAVLYDGESPAQGVNGTVYSDAAFTARAVEVINNHNFAEPLFLFLSLVNPHRPWQAPPSFLPENGFFQRDIYLAMLGVVDTAVKEIVEALITVGAMNNTLLIFSSDNGASIKGPGSNHPLRGAKNSNWEGGLRVPAFITGGFLPESSLGRTLTGMISIADWYSTFINLAGARVNHSGPASVDSADQWPYITGERSQSMRTIIAHTNLVSRNEPATGAIRIDKWKLLVGQQNLASWYAGVPNSNSPEDTACGSAPCLFNIEADPEEREDVASANPDIVGRLMRRFNDFSQEYHAPTEFSQETDLACAAWERAGGYLVPW
eukprot:CAMPEP_0170606214 /NCGR_PEP_ID=MMETSP0224-20130122/20389_1 /TAXON_ID=285029 /ORGANISM="Togula jolla, Strain CCCM 725" /LENGTH=539 /DNA_ID=CAMNT_0010931273 /DNA_START=74 /DNA_END=1690 /DNA_ORIENTATION=+